MSAFDWSTAEPPVWRVIGPEIAETLRRIATMPIKTMRAPPRFPNLAQNAAATRTYKPGRPHGEWLIPK